MGGTLWRPAASSGAALVLALPPLGASARDPSLVALAPRCASAGFAVAAIDLPLHGERHNAKLSKRAIAAASAGDASADAVLWRSLVAQASADLSRALDALATTAPVRVACVAFTGTLPIALAHAAADARVERVFAIGIATDAAPAAKKIVWVARPDDLPSALAQW